MRSTPHLRSYKSSAPRARAGWPRPIGRTGFTLVELLVVIGIIALLISILLPALGRARSAAKTVQCASNMRQVAIGLLQYIMDNKGQHPPASIDANSTGVWPNGFCWVNELVSQGYLKAPQGQDAPGTGPRVTVSNVFRCPEGIDEPGADPAFPTDGRGFGHRREWTPSADHLVPFWYQLLTRLPDSGQRATHPTDGVRIYPFVSFQSGHANSGHVTNPDFQRRLSMIRRHSQFVMIVETPTRNIQSNGTRLSARHGSKTALGTNAYMNLAFFDGHVSLWPSQPYVASTRLSSHREPSTIFHVGDQ